MRPQQFPTVFLSIQVELHSSGNAPFFAPILCMAHALGLHFLLQLQVFSQPLTPGQHFPGSLDVLTAQGHRRRQPVTLGLDSCNFRSIVTAAQAVVTLLAGNPQLSCLPVPLRAGGTVPG